MRRTLAMAVGALVAAGTLAPALAASRTGPSSFTEHTFAATTTTPARKYWLYTPANLGPHRPLVVFLHGCNETALQTAQASRFNTLADQQLFSVVYPEQAVATNSSAPLADGNGVGCWNWFLPEDQARGAGEPGAIAGLTQAAIQATGADPRHIYVEGVSAGADMAVILGATYPDLFTAVGSLAGCAYSTCRDSDGSLTHRAQGQFARVVPMFVENGSADTLNPVTLSVGLAQSWIGADNAAGGGVSRTPSSVATFEADQVPQPGSGDACLHNDSLTCPGGVVGFQGSYPYTVSKFDDAAGHDELELWVIHGMQHAHPDAPGDGPYTDPLGPDVSAASYAFFQAASR